MGSVQNFGEVCPVCGKRALVTDYYYRTDEEYDNCMYCGWHKSVEIKRDDAGKFMHKTSLVAPLPDDRLILGEFRYENGKPHTISDLSSFYPVPAEMDTDRLYDTLNNAVDGTCRMIFLVQEDKTLVPVSYHLTKMTVKDSTFTAEDVIWEQEEYGGYGLLCVDLPHMTRMHPLQKNDDLEQILQEMPAEDREHAYGVKLDENHANPTFINTSKEAWASMTIVPEA